MLKISTHSQRLSIGLMLILGLTFLSACSNEYPTPRTATQSGDPGDSGNKAALDKVGSAKTLFEQVQYGVLDQHCVSCHDGNPAIPLDFSDMNATKASFFDEEGHPKLALNAVANQNGWQIVRPGDPEKSFLVRKLAQPGIGEGSPMPSLGAALNETAIELVSFWIEKGADLDMASIPNMTMDEMKDTGERVLEKLMFEDPHDNCEQCHPKHVEQWEMSSHAYAPVDPVFLAMSELGQKATKGKLGQFCVQCHSPIGFVRDEVPVFEDPVSGDFKQDFSQLTPIANKGVSCDVCHSITEVIEPFNAKMSMTPNGTKLGGIRDPEYTDAHASAYSELHKESEVCASCHNVVNPKGADLEETFTEWENSSFAIGPDKKTCQGCHMPASEGPAATDGPERTIHDHLMPGVDVSLLSPEAFPGYYELREASAKVLQSAANMTAEFIDNGSMVEVTLENQTGHALPSGATAERQMWIDIVVTAPDGEVLFESGQLDVLGDLMDGNPKHSVDPDGDPQLVKFGQDMLDVESVAEGEDFHGHVVMMPWQASGIKNHLLGVDETKSFVYDLGGVDVPQGSTANIVLRFRSFPMYFLRFLEDEAGLDPEVKRRVPIVDMQSAVITL